jgi:hypothetical protein
VLLLDNKFQLAGCADSGQRLQVYDVLKR